MFQYAYNQKLEERKSNQSITISAIVEEKNAIPAEEQLKLTKKFDYIDKIPFELNALEAKPQQKIYFFNQTNYKETLYSSLEQWNKTNLGIEFIETYNKNEAGLFFQTHPLFLQSICRNGYQCVGMMANNGYTPADPGLIILNSKKWEMRKTLVHEIGHYLGLEHSEEKCSVMEQGWGCPSILSPKAVFDPKETCGLKDADKAALDVLYPEVAGLKRNYSAIIC